MTTLPPWANGPFELLLHAETHLRRGEDFDRRICLISFDNAIEVAITTYLSLHPIQRGNREYQKADIEKWLDSYHSKLDFLDAELGVRGLAWEVEKGHIVWAHYHRNEQYHGGAKGTPEKLVLALIRHAALWIFGLLFEVGDVALDQEIAARLPSAAPPREDAYDRAIDREYGMLEIGRISYYASELLFSVDVAAYRELGASLCDTEDGPVAEEEGQ